MIVGLEASGYSTWFVELLEGLGHRVLIGDATEVRRLARRRQKNDRRDAALLLDLLPRDEFPQIYRPPFESREVLRLLRHRHELVQRRTRVKNGLQALAFSAGSSGRSRLLSRGGRERFLQLPMSEAMRRQREEWLSLVDDLNRRIKSLDAWLDERARQDERVMRLQTHPGIGLLTSLALVHALRRRRGLRVEARRRPGGRPGTDHGRRPVHRNRRPGRGSARAGRDVRPLVGRGHDARAALLRVLKSRAGTALALIAGVRCGNCFKA